MKQIDTAPIAAPSGLGCPCEGLHSRLLHPRVRKWQWSGLIERSPVLLQRHDPLHGIAPAQMETTNRVSSRASSRGLSDPRRAQRTRTESTPTFRSDHAAFQKTQSVRQIFSVYVPCPRPMLCHTCIETYIMRIVKPFQLDAVQFGQSIYFRLAERLVRLDEAN